jgi:hypothetical protein
MYAYLMYGGPPWLLLILIVIVNFFLITVGNFVGRYLESNQDDRANAAFSTAQASIYGLTTLILAFSFSLAAGHYDSRGNLVVREANAIATTYLRAGYLRPVEAARFRALLSSYTRLEIQTYSDEPDLQTGADSINRSAADKDELWDIATQAGRADPRNVQLGLLTEALNETIDASNTLTIAKAGHLPATVVGLILILTFASAAMLGATFGRARRSAFGMSIVFSVLFAFVVFAIVDLDRPERGVVNISLAPLQSELDLMRHAPTGPLRP